MEVRGGKMDVGEILGSDYKILEYDGLRACEYTMIEI
jgi:hypothetical protein